MTTSAAPVTLYGYATSPYVQKVNCFLTFKEIDFDVVYVDPVKPVQIEFSGQSQVPILGIGDEWRIDSTPIGIWLDERFPQHALLPADPAARHAVLAIDCWVSETFIPGMLFRQALDWTSIPAGLVGGWRLAQLLHSTRALALPLRLSWPFLLRRVPFIHRIVDSVGRSEPQPAMRRRIVSEFLDHLGDGPFLGGRGDPTLADLSLYGVLIQTCLTLPPRFVKGGSRRAIPGHPAFVAWMQRVHERMPHTPLLVGDNQVTQPLPF